MNNQFEQHIKLSLDNYEALYNPADWADLKNRLSKINAGKASGIGKGLMIAASVAAVAGAIYYFSASNSENNKQENAVIPSQHIVQAEAKENPVQTNKGKDQQPVMQHPSSVNSENSNKEKAFASAKVPENKSASTEKIETQTAVLPENKSDRQEQVHPSNNNLPPSENPVDRKSVV